MSCPSLGVDDRARRLSVMCAGVGVVLTLAASATVISAVVDPFADISSARYIARIDTAPHLWLVIHFAIAVGALCKLVGLLGIADHIDRHGTSLLVRAANTLAVVGTTLFVVTMVFDGYVHGYIAQRWQQSSAGDRRHWADIFGASLRTSYGMEIASVLVLLGFAPVLYGLAMRSSTAFAPWLSRLAVAGGAGATGTAAVLWLGGPTAVGYGLLYPLFAMLVPSVWLLAAARQVWRAGRSAPSTAGIRPRVTVDAASV